MTKNLKLNMLTDQVGELIIDNPSRRNALSAQMWEHLPHILEQAENTKGLRALIVRGDGDHFSSGADISEFGTLYATAESSKKISLDIAAGFKALANFPLPTLAMIRGSCVGGGCGLALSCDVRFADTTSKYAISPAKLGLAYPFADVKRLIETVGIPNAKDILFSARLIQAKSARKMGLINQLFKVDNLEEKTLDYAKTLAALSPSSLRISKKMFSAYQAGQREETEQSRTWFSDGFSSTDFQEGYKAFLEKRKPNFD